MIDDKLREILLEIEWNGSIDAPVVTAETIAQIKQVFENLIGQDEDELTGESITVARARNDLRREIRHRMYEDIKEIKDE